MPTLEAALATYLKVDRSDYTNRNYQNCLEKMIAAIGPKRRMCLVTYDDLLGYTDDLRQEYQPSSYHQFLSIIKSFFNWAVKVRYLDWSPASMLTVRNSPISSWEEKAVPEQVLDRAMFLAHSDPRDYAVMAFMKATAARVGGVASLRIPNIDLHNGQAWIRNKGGAYYWVYFGENTIQALKAYLAVRPDCAHNHVFVAKRDPDEPLSPPAYSRIVAHWTKQAGGTAYRGHSIRHRTTHDWNMLYPVDVLQAKLNHARLDTTTRYLPRQINRLSDFSRNMDRLRNDAPSQPRVSKIIPLDDIS